MNLDDRENAEAPTSLGFRTAVRVENQALTADMLHFGWELTGFIRIQGGSSAIRGDVVENSIYVGVSLAE